MVMLTQFQKQLKDFFVATLPERGGLPMWLLFEQANWVNQTVPFGFLI